MFVADATRPVEQLPNGNTQNVQWDWDGNIGLYPLVEEHFAWREDNQTGL
jgi:hypothetical protein